MARAYKCDRCGVFFERDAEAEKDIKYRVVGGEYDLCYISGYAPVHLCPDCSKKLHEWMENKPEPNLHHIYLNVHRPDPCPRCSFTCEPKKKRWWEK